MTGILSDECRSSYPYEPWKCQLGQYRMPFVKTSFFMVASQFDAYQLHYLTGVGSGTGSLMTAHCLSVFLSACMMCSLQSNLIPSVRDCIIQRSSCFVPRVSERRRRTRRTSAAIPVREQLRCLRPAVHRTAGYWHSQAPTRSSSQGLWHHEHRMPEPCYLLHEYVQSDCIVDRGLRVHPVRIRTVPGRAEPPHISDQQQHC